MQHDGDQACTEQEEPRHRPVRHGGGEEAPNSDVGGYLGEYRDGLPSLWKTAREGQLP